MNANRSKHSSVRLIELWSPATIRLLSYDMVCTLPGLDNPPERHRAVTTHRSRDAYHQHFDATLATRGDSMALLASRLSDPPTITQRRTPTNIHHTKQQITGCPHYHDDITSNLVSRVYISIACQQSFNRRPNTLHRCYHECGFTFLNAIEYMK